MYSLFLLNEVRKIDEFYFRLILMEMITYLLIYMNKKYEKFHTTLNIYKLNAIMADFICIWRSNKINNLLFGLFWFYAKIYECKCRIILYIYDVYKVEDKCEEQIGVYYAYTYFRRSK